MNIRAIKIDQRPEEDGMREDEVLFCCGCNRAKDNDDSWSYAYPENFIRARIVYGLCPKCMEEMYPNDLKNNENTYLKKEHMRPAYA